MSTAPRITHSPASYELADERRVEKLVLEVANALQRECQQVFGSNWNNDVARQFARRALLQIESTHMIVPLKPR